MSVRRQGIFRRGPRVRRAMLLGVAATTLSACFKLGRNAPPVQRYALATPRSTPAPPATAGTRGITVGLRRAQLASYLAVPEVVVRRGEHRIDASEFHLWGGALDEAINRVVAAYLSGEKPVRAVDVAPWGTGTTHDYVVQLRVGRFEGAAGDRETSGAAYVQVAWDIIRPRTGALLLRGSTEQRTPWRVGEYPELIRGLESGLGQVARDIGACLARFPNDSTPPSACGSGEAAR